MIWRRAMGQAFILLVLSCVAGALTHLFHPRAPAWYWVSEPLTEEEVTLEGLDREWGGEIFWLDARTEEQFKAGHIPGAHLLNEMGFDDQLFAILDELQQNRLPVVIYCGSESCQASHKIRSRLLETFPLENVRVLRGGWPIWVQAGRPVER